MRRIDPFRRRGLGNKVRASPLPPPVSSYAIRATRHKMTRWRPDPVSAPVVPRPGRRNPSVSLETRGGPLDSISMGACLVGGQATAARPRSVLFSMVRNFVKTLKKLRLKMDSRVVVEWALWVSPRRGQVGSFESSQGRSGAPAHLAESPARGQVGSFAFAAETTARGGRGLGRQRLGRDRGEEQAPNLRESSS